MFRSAFAALATWGAAITSSYAAPPQATASPRANLPAPLTKPFDASASSVPAAFNGHDVLHIMKTLKPLPKKSEFETLEEFEQRKAKWADVPYSGSLKPSETLAFVVGAPTGPSALSAVYDAESETFKATVSFETQYLSDASGGTRWLELYFDSTTGPPRPAVTRMGVRFTVRERTTHSVGLALDEMIETVETSFKASRAEAPAIKAGLRALALAKIAEPWQIRDVQTHTASLTDPIQWTQYYFAVGAKLISIWFYDARTGTVHAKVDGPFRACQYGYCVK